MAAKKETSTKKKNTKKKEPLEVVAQKPFGILVVGDSLGTTQFVQRFEEDEELDITRVFGLEDASNLLKREG
ncbi:MAG: hypothetical protein AAF585_00360 [Verrucomicrobiota bacterium]